MAKIVIQLLQIEPHKILITYTNFQLYFIHIGVRVMKMTIMFVEQDKIKSLEILIILNLVSIVIKNGMKILGVSLPEKM